MTRVTPPDEEPRDAPPILDVREYELGDLLAGGDSALANAVRLVVDGLDADEGYAAHGSSP